MASVLCIDLIFFNGYNVELFLPPSLFCLFFGVLFAILFKTKISSSNISRSEIILLVISIWLTISISSSLPFYNYVTFNKSFASSILESVSCITTTGFTIYDNITSLPISLQIWRLFLNVIGGAGIIAIAIVALPMMRVGGMQLFRVENSGQSGHISNKTSKMAASFIGFYLSAIFIAISLLIFCGMSPLYAAINGIGSISTAGCYITPEMSTSAIKIILSGAMIIGGINFFDIIKLSTRHHNSQNLVHSQIKCYFSVIFFTFMIVSASIILNKASYNFCNCLFDVASASATAGSTPQIHDRNAFIDAALFFVMCLGGCSGSTSGGIKIFRFQILCSIIKNFIKKTSNRYLISTPKYQDDNIDYNLSMSIVSYFIFLFLAIIVSILSICIFDANASISSISLGVISSIFNSGQYIDVNSFTNATKMIFAIDMMIGRLDVVPVMLLMNSEFWKKR